MSRALVLLLLLVPLVCGCVAVAAAGVVGVGVVQYQRNESTQDFRTDLATTWHATLEGMRRLGFGEPKGELGPTEGTITEQDISVRVERHAEGFTRVRVRLGTFYTDDHERRAELLLKEISSSLEDSDELRAWAEKVKGTSQPDATPRQK